MLLRSVIIHFMDTINVSNSSGIKLSRLKHMLKSAIILYSFHYHSRKQTNKQTSKSVCICSTNATQKHKCEKQKSWEACGRAWDRISYCDKRNSRAFASKLKSVFFVLFPSQSQKLLLLLCSSDSARMGKIIKLKRNLLTAAMNDNGAKGRGQIETLAA